MRSRHGCLWLASLGGAAILPTETPPSGSLVVQHDVWPPDELRGDANGSHVVVVPGVPAQLVVPPLLHRQNTQLRGTGGDGGQWRGAPSLTCFTHTFVVIIWFFSS